jgi:hypothetical protein
MMRFLAVCVAVIGCWFFLPSLVVVVQGSPPGSMPVPLPVTCLVVGAALIGVAAFMWRSSTVGGTAQLDDAAGEVRVAVSSGGAITLDGEAASLAELRKRLEAASGTDAVVLYYRESSQAEPSQEVLAVFEVVMTARLPISLSSKPDFSTVITGDGTVEQRR